ncbi:MAG: hypothetical protein ACREGD_04275 [Candidatus Saccharimonadales bacterium]
MTDRNPFGKPLNSYEEARFQQIVAGYHAAEFKEEASSWRRAGDALSGFSLVSAAAAAIALSPMEGIPEMFSVPEFGVVMDGAAVGLAVVGLAMRIKSNKLRAEQNPNLLQ